MATPGVNELAGSSIAGSVAGGALSIFGNILKGNAASEAASYRAAVANNYARFYEKQGDQQAQIHGLKVGQIIGSQKAAQGASGLDVNTGSAVDVRASAAQTGRLDELTILNNAANKALGLRAEAALETQKADNAITEGMFGAGTSLLSAATSVSDKWLTYKNKGVF